jgi:YHS domain-containing protein
MGVLLLLGIFFLLFVCFLVAAVLCGMIFWPSESQQPTNSAAGNELVRDPICGRYVSRKEAVTAVMNGQKLFFCSRFCRVRYTKRLQRRTLEPKARRHKPERLQQ